MALPIPAELLTGKQLGFEDIKQLVIKHGFGVVPATHNGLKCGISHGIDYALLTKGITVEEVAQAFDRFLSGDFGTFYEEGETPRLGHEYGEYPSSFGNTTGTGAIMVHREVCPQVPWSVVAYFQFER